MTVGPRLADLSVSETSEDFPPTTVSGVFSEWCEKERMSSE